MSRAAGSTRVPESRRLAFARHAQPLRHLGGPCSRPGGAPSAVADGPAVAGTARGQGMASHVLVRCGSVRGAWLPRRGGRPILGRSAPQPDRVTRMPQFDLSATTDGEWAVLALSGELDLATGPAVRECLHELIGGGV